MQDDINAGAQSLAASGTADPKRIAIVGLSYGGFAALAGAALTPDLYTAAVDMSGPSDLALLLKSITTTLPDACVLFVQSVGDPFTPEGQAQLKRQSPINAADKIKAPLLIIQGGSILFPPRSSRTESSRRCTRAMRP